MQNLNWSSIDQDQSELIYLSFGYNFGVTTQIGYAHKFNLKKPIVLSAAIAVPMGKKPTDDYNLKIGGQMSIVKLNHLRLNAKAYGIYRSHKTKLVQMRTFGTELATVLGFYKPKWHLAGEIGYDASISTHLKHSEIFSENNPSYLLEDIFTMACKLVKPLAIILKSPFDQGK